MKLRRHEKQEQKLAEANSVMDGCRTKRDEKHWQTADGKSDPGIEEQIRTGEDERIATRSKGLWQLQKNWKEYQEQKAAFAKEQEQFWRKDFWRKERRCQAEEILKKSRRRLR